MLNKLINKDTILLNEEVKDWEEAIRLSGNILLKNKFITNDYIDAMIQSVKDLGPYIVIVENVAMPHARPEDGVKSLGMSLLTLKTPINFGHSENDPVKLVISFSAPNSNIHLEMLSELMELLDSKLIIKNIINAKSKDEVLDIIDSLTL